MRREETDHKINIFRQFREKPKHCKKFPMKGTKTFLESTIVRKSDQHVHRIYIFEKNSVKN